MALFASRIGKTKPSCVYSSSDSAQLYYLSHACATLHRHARSPTSPSSINLRAIEQAI